MPLKRLACILVLALQSSFSLSMPLFNVDFGDNFTGTSSGYGAASGQTGTWNIITALGVTGLTDITGAATTASVTSSGRSFGSGAYGSPDGNLLTDMLWGSTLSAASSDWSVIFNGLSDGFYDVYYYAATHPMPTGTLSINGTGVTALPGNNGVPSLIQGTSWDVLMGVNVTGGMLTITGINSAGGSWAGYSGIAGIQLLEGSEVPTPTVPIPATIPLLILGIAALVYSRRC